MLSKVLFAAGINHQTKALNGVYVEIKGNNVKFIGCDGFRFAMCDKVCEVHNDSDEELDTNFIIPVKTVMHANLQRRWNAVELQTKSVLRKVISGMSIFFLCQIRRQYSSLMHGKARKQ